MEPANVQVFTEELFKNVIYAKTYKPTEWKHTHIQTYIINTKYKIYKKICFTDISKNGLLLHYYYVI